MVHEKQATVFKKRAPMIRTQSHRQLSLAEFDWPLQTALDEENRWVKMTQCIPWDECVFQTKPATHSTAKLPPWGWSGAICTDSISEIIC